MLIDSYSSMIVRFASPAIRGFLSPLLSLSLSPLFMAKENLWDQDTCLLDSASLSHPYHPLHTCFTVVYSPLVSVASGHSRRYVGFLFVCSCRATSILGHALKVKMTRNGPEMCSSVLNNLRIKHNNKNTISIHPNLQCRHN